MASLVSAVLLLAMTGYSSATWCTCKGLNDAILQKALDYACGAGADCNPVHENGPCYNPNTVRAHCNYAVNSYFQRKGQAAGACDFAGAAAVTTADPSYAGCAYPSSASPTTTSSTPTPTTPGTATPTTPTTPSTTTPVGGGGTPFITNPSNGVLGGNGSGVLGPTGPGINTDTSHCGFVLEPTIFLSSFTSLLFSGLVSLWT